MKPTTTSSLGSQIDALYQQDLKIRAQLKILKDLKSKRKKLEDKLLKNFDKDEIGGATGKTGKARLEKGRHPNIKDRKKFWKYVVKNRAFDLVQNRISSRAYFDRIEEGEEVPGVKIFDSFHVRVTKR